MDFSNDGFNEKCLVITLQLFRASSLNIADHASTGHGCPLRDYLQSGTEKTSYGSETDKQRT